MSITRIPPSGVLTNSNFIFQSVSITATTSSISTTTGALIVAGGAGIGGNIYAGNIYSNGQLVATGSATFNGGTVTGVAQFTNTSSSTSTNTGAVTVSGGVGIGGNAYIGGTLNVGGTVIASASGTSINGLTATFVNVVINSTVNSINTNTGALRVQGGAAFDYNVVVGGTITRVGLEISPAVYASVNSNATISLGTTSSYHILYALNSGLSLTLSYPASPADGTIISWTVVSNTNPNITQSGGTFVPTFSGGASYGLTVKYIYNSSQTTWYRIQ